MLSFSVSNQSKKIEIFLHFLKSNVYLITTAHFNSELSTVQVHNSHTWLVATILVRAGID